MMQMTKPLKPYLRVLCWVLCIACTVALFPWQAAAAEPGDQIRTTKVHWGPSADSVVIGLMEQGTAVTVLGESDGFYQIDCYDMTGYVHKEQLTYRLEYGYYVNCKPASPETYRMPCQQWIPALYLRHSLLQLARKQLGYPYVYGGKAPGGFDCSGLTYYLYGSHELPIHRTASQQLQDGIIVAKEGLQIGDLVFFREPFETTAASHVGIYAGDNQIIHAGSKGICYADLDGSYFRDYYLCARRIIHTGMTQPESPAETEALTIPGLTPGISGRTIG